MGIVVFKPFGALKHDICQFSYKRQSLECKPLFFITQSMIPSEGSSSVIA